MTPPDRRTVLRAAATAAVAVPLAAPLAACSPAGSSPPTAVPPSGGSTGSTVAGAAPLGLTFPKDFRWGAATSAYQVEGAAAEDGRGPSIWDTFARERGRIRDGSTGDVAADHYHRYREDVALMATLGLDSYRFSISWPRVLPAGTGKVNAKGLDFYRRLVDELRGRDIAPVATLYHWDLPQPLQERGGWLNRDCASWFAEYTATVVKALGDVVPTWLTINEPKTLVNVAYRQGGFPPAATDEAQAYVAMHHLLLGHGLAVRATRASGHKVDVGPALNLAPAYPDDPASADDKAAARLADGFENRLYLDAVLKGSYPADVLASLDAAGNGSALKAANRDGDLAVIGSPVDLLAVQYYNPVFIAAPGRYVTKLPTSDASWQQIYPDGFHDVLTRIRRDYGNPRVVVTENGRPNPDVVGPDGRVDDPARIEFLRSHLAAAHKAIAEGVRLESFHVWSLLDNFEWAEGLSQRWGIVYVDFGTQQRIPKSSAGWYQGVIARNGL